MVAATEVEVKTKVEGITNSRASKMRNGVLQVLKERRDSGIPRVAMGTLKTVATEITGETDGAKLADYVHTAISSLREDYNISCHISKKESDSIYSLEKGPPEKSYLPSNNQVFRQIAARRSRVLALVYRSKTIDKLVDEGFCQEEAEALTNMMRPSDLATDEEVQETGEKKFIGEKLAESALSMFSTNPESLSAKNIETDLLREFTEKELWEITGVPMDEIPHFIRERFPQTVINTVKKINERKSLTEMESSIKKLLEKILRKNNGMSVKQLIEVVVAKLG